VAADYITKEIRYAYNIEVLDNLPTPLADGRRYFAVEGNSIKYYINTEEPIDILNENSPEFLPVLSFQRHVEKYKVLKFSVGGSYKEQNFGVSSEVLPLNIQSDIVGEVSGAVLAFSTDVTDREIVYIDTVYLDLITLNSGILDKVTDGYIFKRSSGQSSNQPETH